MPLKAADRALMLDVMREVRKADEVTLRVEAIAIDRNVMSTVLVGSC